MAFRFRRSIKILPGIRVNFGKRSASVTVGGRGAHVTLRPGHKARATVSLPGTGLSYTQGGSVAPRAHSPGIEVAAPPADTSRRNFLLVALGLTVILCIVLNSLGR